MDDRWAGIRVAQIIRSRCAALGCSAPSSTMRGTLLSMSANCCAAGTESFCFAMHEPVRRTHAEFPEFIFKVLTDDVLAMCPLPKRRDEDGWRHTLKRYSDMLDFLGSELAKIGLTFNREKGAVLVPKDAVADFQRLNPTTSGFIVRWIPDRGGRFR